ncbi:MAG TPA: hypothetical protein PK598_07520, partial [Thermoanaerobaculia bacterium]|nr:hypothetical protein [Thermoanaerobaculia bacterium]
MVLRTNGPGRCLWRRLGLGVVVASIAGAAPAARSAEISLTELSALRAEVSGHDVAGLALERDAFRFEFQSGAVFPLSPLRGRIVGALFVGSGRFRLTPSSEVERRHLALRTGDASLSSLSVSFEEAVFLFTDDSLAELTPAGGAAVRGAPERLNRAWERFRKLETKELGTTVDLRILADLLERSPKERGVFLACFAGAKLPPAFAVFAPRGLPASGFAQDFGTE